MYEWDPVPTYHLFCGTEGEKNTKVEKEKGGGSGREGGKRDTKLERET